MRALCLLIIIAALPGVARAAEDWQTGPGFAQVQFAAPGNPTLYIHYDKGKLQIAGSAAGLASAKAWAVEKTERDRYENGQVRVETHEYRMAPLPLKLPGFTSASIEPAVHFVWNKQLAQQEHRSSTLIGKRFSCLFEFAYRDRAGLWTYITDSTTGLSPTAKEAAKHQTRERVPDPKQLALTVEAKPENGKLGIGVHLRSGGAAVTNLMLDGKSAPMRITVKDPSGKTVHAHSGDVQTFGFT